MGPHSRRLGALAGLACLFAAGLSLATAHAGRGNTSAPLVERSVLVADFEQSLHGWRPYHAVMRRARNGIRGFGARVLPRSARVHRYWIYADPRPVQTTALEVTYGATAWVRSLGHGQPVCLKLREIAAHRTVGAALSCVWAV